MAVKKVKPKFGELISNSKIHHAMKTALSEELQTNCKTKLALKLKLAKCCIEICSHTTVMFKPVHREDKSTYGSCKCNKSIQLVQFSNESIEKE